MSLFGFGFVVAIPPKLVVVAAGWPNVVLWPKSVMFNQCVFVILCVDKNFSYNFSLAQVTIPINSPAH